MRLRYRFAVIGYVVMPEHVHLLVSEPLVGTPSIVVQAVKLGFAQRLFGKSNSKAPLLARDARNGAPSPGETCYPEPRHFWQRRFYDFNVWSQPKEVEKLKYMHRNPVVRGLVESPEHLAVEQFPVLCLWRSRAGPDQRLVVVGAEDSGGCFVW